MSDSRSRVRQYILGWIGLPFMAVLNGILRELTYCRVVGDHAAHQISSVILCMIICSYVLILNTRIQLRTRSEGFFAGFVWLVLTVLFEAFLGLLTGVPIREQLEAYNILSGNLWVLVLATVFTAPVLLRGQRLVRLFG